MKSPRTPRSMQLVVAVFALGWLVLPSARADFFLISDVGTNQIYEYNSSTQATSVYLSVTSAQGSLFGITKDNSGNVYYSTLGTGEIFKAGSANPIANLRSPLGDGYPGYLAFAQVGAANYIVANDYQQNRMIFVPLAGGSPTPVTLTGGTTGGTTFPVPLNPTGVTVSGSDMWVVGSQNGEIIHYTIGSSGGTPTLTFKDGLPFNGLQAVSNAASITTFNSGGINFGKSSPTYPNVLYSNFSPGGNATTGTIGWFDGTQTHDLGNPTATAFLPFNQPSGLAVDAGASTNTSLSLFVLSSKDHALFNVTGNAQSNANKWTSSAAIDASTFKVPIGIIDFGSSAPLAVQDDPPAAPEPASWVLLGLGGVGLLTYGRYKRPLQGS